MSEAPTRALLNSISGRTELLECLMEGITEKREIEERIGKSRTTVNRWLGDLADADIVTSEDDGYRVTIVGRIAYEQYEAFEGQVSDLFNAKPLLLHLPPDVDLDMRLLGDAEILLSNEIAPHEPVLRLEDMVRKATTRELRGVSPVVLPRYVEFFHEQIVDQELIAEFVLEPAVLEYLVTTYNEMITEVMETGHGDFYRMDGAGLPYGLAVIDEEGVWVGIYEAGGGLRGAIINTSPPAIEWGRQQYEKVKERAERLDPSDIMLRGATP